MRTLERRVQRMEGVGELSKIIPFGDLVRENLTHHLESPNPNTHTHRNGAPREAEHPGLSGCWQKRK